MTAGLGLSLLIDTIRLIEPSHILQLLPSPEPKNPPILNEAYMKEAMGWCMDRDLTRGEQEWKPEYILIHTPWSVRDQ